MSCTKYDRQIITAVMTLVVLAQVQIHCTALWQHRASPYFLIS